MSEAKSFFVQLILKKQPFLSETDFQIIDGDRKFLVTDLENGEYTIIDSKNELNLIKREDLLQDIVFTKKIATMGNLVALLNDDELNNILKKYFGELSNKYDVEIRKVSHTDSSVVINVDLDISLELGEQGLSRTISLPMNLKTIEEHEKSLEVELQKNCIWCKERLDNELFYNSPFQIRDYYMKAVKSKGIKVTKFKLPREVLEKLGYLKNELIKNITNGNGGVKKAFLSDRYMKEISQCKTKDDFDKIISKAGKMGFSVYAEKSFWDNSDELKLNLEGNSDGSGFSVSTLSNSNTKFVEFETMKNILDGKENIDEFLNPFKYMFFSLDLERQVEEYLKQEEVKHEALNNDDNNQSEAPLLNDLVDSVFGHEIVFKKQKTPFDFSIKLRLKKEDGGFATRNIGTLIIPKSTGTVVFRTTRNSGIHYMYAMGGYGFNYKLINYLLNERFIGKKVIIRIEEEDSGKTYITSAKNIYEARDENVLNFKKQGFETQIFYSYDKLVEDTKKFQNNTLFSDAK